MRTLTLALAVVATLPAQADVVTDWSIAASDIVTDAKIGTPPANRVFAFVQTAVHEAVLSLQMLPAGGDTDVACAAAVAAANRATLEKLLPLQHASIAKAYEAALAKLPDNAARAAGV